MLGDVTGPNGADSGAWDLVVRATANDRSVAGSDTRGGGLVQVGIANVKANTTPTVNAQIGGTVDVRNDIIVQADSRTDADTSNDSAGGGAVAVTDLHATVTLNPTVTTTVAVDARLTAGNDITIGANHGRALPFRVTVDGGIVNDDTGLVDFVVVGFGATVTKVFTIANVGDANLVITSPIMPAGFTLVTAPDLTTIPPGGSTTFEIGIDTAAVGPVSGEISFSVDDSINDPVDFNFVVQGLVIPDAPFGLSFDVPPAFDGIAKATASGAAGGVVQVSSVTTSLTATPNVSLTVNAGAELSAIRNIDIQSEAVGKASAIAEGDGGGVVAVGVSNSDVKLTPKSTLKINEEAVLNATGDDETATTGSITVISTTSSDAFAKGRGVSGGFVAVADATVTTNVSHASTVEIGDSAQLTTNGEPASRIPQRYQSHRRLLGHCRWGCGRGDKQDDTQPGFVMPNPRRRLRRSGPKHFSKAWRSPSAAVVTKLDLKVDADEEADGRVHGCDGESADDDP